MEKSALLVLAILLCSLLPAGCIDEIFPDSRVNNVHSTSGSHSDDWYDDYDDGPSPSMEYCELYGSCDDGVCNAHPMCQVCGDGVLFRPEPWYFEYDWLESCDGTDLGGATCESVIPGSSGGALSCDARCTFVIDKCLWCGNGIIEGTESCDGTNVPQQCTDVWDFEGPPGCNTSCQEDYNGCHVSLPVDYKLPVIHSDGEGGLLAGDQTIGGIDRLDTDLNLMWTLALGEADDLVTITRIDSEDDGSFTGLGTISRPSGNGTVTIGVAVQFTRDGTLLWRQELPVHPLRLAYRGESGQLYVVGQYSQSQEMMYVLSAEGTPVISLALGYGKFIIDVREEEGSLLVHSVGLKTSINSTYHVYTDVFNASFNRVEYIIQSEVPAFPYQILKREGGTRILYSSGQGNNFCSISLESSASWCINVPDLTYGTIEPHIDNSGDYHLLTADLGLRRYDPSGQLVKTVEWAPYLPGCHALGIVQDARGDYLLAVHDQQNNRTLLVRIPNL